MARLFRTFRERGSVEVVLLIIVLAAIAGLAAWRVNEAQEAQRQAQAVLEKRQAASANDARITAATLGVSFEKLEGHGNINLEEPQTGGFPSVTLVSKKLTQAKYTCKGENSGEFGTLALVDASSNGPQSQYTKDINDATYGFTNGLTEVCYSAELLKEFRGTVPQAIIESLEPLKTDGKDTADLENQ